MIPVIFAKARDRGRNFCRDRGRRAPPRPWHRRPRADGNRDGRGGDLGRVWCRPQLFGPPGIAPPASAVTTSSGAVSLRPTSAAGCRRRRRSRRCR